jgi:hypothetical protein
MTKQRKERVLSAEQPCRRCGGKLERREHRANWKPSAGQRYWFGWWFRCKACHTVYLVEAAKVHKTPQPTAKRALSHELADVHEDQEILLRIRGTAARDDPQEQQRRNVDRPTLPGQEHRRDFVLKIGTMKEISHS